MFSIFSISSLSFASPAWPHSSLEQGCGPAETGAEVQAGNVKDWRTPLRERTPGNNYIVTESSISDDQE